MCRLGPQTRLWIYLFKNPNFRKSRRKYCEEIILKTPRLESRLESSARVNRMWLSAQTNSQQSGGFYLLLPLWRQQDLLWILCAISHNLPLSSSSGHDFHNKQFLDLNLCLDVLWSSGLGGGSESAVSSTAGESWCIWAPHAGECGLLSRIFPVDFAHYLEIWLGIF